MSVLFVVWLVTTNLVNFAFYLAVTRVHFGWVRTVGFFLLGYGLPFALYMAIHCLHIRLNEREMAYSMSYGFALCCAIWAVNVLVMSRGPLGRRIFAILVVAIHQVGVFSVGFLAMRRLEPTWVGEILAIALMAGTGILQIRRGIPVIHRMDDAAGWRELNLTAVLLFMLLYATGIWPSYVAAGGWRDIVVFLLVNLVSLICVPLVLSFADRNRAVRVRRLMANNARVLQSELRIARASEDGARRIRHDARHYVEVLRNLLREGKADEALRYLEHSISHELLLSPSNDRWCANPLVDSILKVGSMRAHAKGLDFRAEARVPVIIGIDELDLVALLSNLIENAVNGAAGGTVRVSVIEDRGALRIGVANRVPPDFRLVGGFPCERPGVGIVSVRAEVEKYHGLFDYTHKGDELAARVMIMVK